MKIRPNSILATTCFAICGWFFVQPEAVNAVSVRLEESTNDAYLYTVELAPGESLEQEDRLRFTKLFGVTDADADSPYVVDFLDFDEVDLRVQTDTPGPDTINVAIYSTAEPGMVEYIADYQDVDGFTDAEIGMIRGPAAQAVPFEFSPSNGLLSLAVLFGFKRGWKFLMSKEKPTI